MKKIIPAGVFLLFAACNPVDRSGEQPFAPTVKSVSAVVDGDSCLLTGCVLSSPNSEVRQRGFSYGNDTLRLEVLSEDVKDPFSAATRPLEPGRYFAVAFASNGIGVTYADTLLFEIPEDR